MPPDLPPPLARGIGDHPAPTARPDDFLPLRLVRVVLAVAQAGSVSGAGALLHQSASAVTRALQQAEGQLGVTLFERGARGMVCTPAVARWLPRAQRARELLAPVLPGALPRGLGDTPLRAMLAVASAGSEAAAARALGLRQPSVRQALAQLEHVSRQRLFDRSARGTRLTEAGRRLLGPLQLALAELRAADDELTAFRGSGGSQVVVGVLPMAGERLVPQALARVLSGLPGLRATAVDGTYEALVDQLRQAGIDCMVGPLRGAAAAADLQEELLFVDQWWAVVRAGHPALALAQPTLARLSRWPWIGPLTSTPAQAAFERVFAQVGLPVPAVSLRTHSTGVLRSVLRAGDHVALVSPLQVAADLDDGVLCPLPLPLPGSERPIGITWRRDGQPSAACSALLQALRDVAREALPWARPRPGHA